MNNDGKQKIQSFISSISEKKYAAANKYLKEVLDSKMRVRISAVKQKPLFRN